MDFADGKFRVPVDRWEALREAAEGLVKARNGRVQARRLANLTRTVLSMHLSWGPATQLYTRHLYASIKSVRSLNCWVTLTEGAVSELLFWRGLPMVRFVGDIWPPTAGIFIRKASGANDFGWGGQTIEDAPQYAREHFSEEESSQSSTYRELLGVFRCLQVMVHVCEGKF